MGVHFVLLGNQMLPKRKRCRSSTTGMRRGGGRAKVWMLAGGDRNRWYGIRPLGQGVNHAESGEMLRHTQPLD